MSEQLTIDDLKAMTPEEIVLAKAAGELNDLLGIATPDIPAEGQLTREHIQHMTPEQIVEARAAGRFDDLLSGAQTPD